MKGLKFVVGREAKVEGKQHASEPRQYQSSDQQDDQAYDEAEFDPLLNFGRLEGDERHDAAETQSQHQGHEETGHAGSPLTGQPVAQRELVRDEQFNGVKENGVVDGTHDIRRNDLEVHADEGDGCDNLQGNDLPLTPQRFEVERPRFGRPVEVHIRLETDFARHLSTPSPASRPATNPCRASNR